jgi:hypothetical protein
MTCRPARRVGASAAAPSGPVSIAGLVPAVYVPASPPFLLARVARPPFGRGGGMRGLRPRCGGPACFMLRGRASGPRLRGRTCTPWRARRPAAARSRTRSPPAAPAAHVPGGPVRRPSRFVTVLGCELPSRSASVGNHRLTNARRAARRVGRGGCSRRERPQTSFSALNTAPSSPSPEPRRRTAVDSDGGLRRRRQSAAPASSTGMPPGASALDSRLRFGPLERCGRSGERS